jgi:prevent-host-death family protein
MLISITDARRQLTDLVRRAETGEDIVITRHGRNVARLVAIAKRPSPEARRELIRAVQASAAQNATPGPVAARSQDFLYDEDGLPG